jgi:hypothetical protein
LTRHPFVGINARNSLADNRKFFLCLCHGDLP